MDHRSGGLGARLAAGPGGRPSLRGSWPPGRSWTVPGVAWVVRTGDLAQVGRSQRGTTTSGRGRPQAVACHRRSGLAHGAPAVPCRALAPHPPLQPHRADLRGDPPQDQVIGRLPGETSCLGLVWAVLDGASGGWRGLTMTPQGAVATARPPPPTGAPSRRRGVINEASPPPRNLTQEHAPQAVYTTPWDASTSQACLMPHFPIVGDARPHTGNTILAAERATPATAGCQTRMSGRPRPAALRAPVRTKAAT